MRPRGRGGKARAEDAVPGRGQQGSPRGPSRAYDPSVPSLPRAVTRFLSAIGLLWIASCVYPATVVVCHVETDLSPTQPIQFRATVRAHLPSGDAGMADV